MLQINAEKVQQVVNRSSRDDVQVRNPGMLKKSSKTAADDSTESSEL